nr:TetR/AcrR family transcriptional regulator [Bacteroidota bacterium]
MANLEELLNNQKFIKLVETSRELFMKYGIRSLSMDDIAVKMGVSKKTLYLFVSNKADLIDMTLQYGCHKFEKWIDEINDMGLNAIDELLEISKQINDDIHHFNPSITYDLQKYYPDLFKNHFETKKEFIYNHIKENILKGVDQGLYREGMDVDLVAGLYIQKMISFRTDEILHSEKLTFEKIFEVMFENHIRGIANPSGIQYFEKQKEHLNFKN